VPAGWKPVASLGMEVHVPATWRLTGEVSEECGLLTFDTRVVSRPVGVVPAIGCDGIRQGTLVSFVIERPGQKAGREDLGNNITQFTWLSPSGGAVVASGPDVAVLQQVIATARTVAVDSLGCPTTPTRPTWDRPRDGLPPVRLGADVTDVVACVYQGYPFGDAYRTVASARFDAAGRDALAVALRRAPADTTPDPRKTCATVFPGEIFAVLNVRTAAGVIPMTLHWTGCANRYVATAEAQSATTERLLETVMDAVGIGVGYSALPEG
jgi:hypothetical protein